MDNNDDQPSLPGASEDHTRPPPNEQGIEAPTHFPLSPGQESVWIFEQLGPESKSLHQLPVGMALSGSLNIDALRVSLNALMRRHDVLRTRISSENGRASQTIGSQDEAFPLTINDIFEHGDAEVGDVENNYLVEEIDRPFDLARGPLIRGLLLRKSKDEYTLLINQHHIISDGWSIGVLLRELSLLYDAAVSGVTCELPPLRSQYVDYAMSQQEAMYSAKQVPALRYWQELLRDAPQLIRLPTDRPRPHTQSYRIATVPIEMGPILAADLRGLCQAVGVTPFAVLAASWAMLLRWLTGETDIVIGTAAANRLGAEQNHQIGLYASPLPLRFTVRDDQSIESFLKDAHKSIFAGLARQSIPFKRLIEVLRPPRSFSHAPIFQVGLNLNKVSKGGNLKLTGLEVRPLDLPRTRSPYDLTLYLTDDDSIFRGRIEYAQDLFDLATAHRFRDHLLAVLNSVVADRTRNVGSISILTAAQQREILRFSWGPDRPPQGPETIHELFESHVRARPQHIAVEYESVRLTYGDLNSKANQLSHHLVSLGAGPGARVAICTDRTPQMVIAVLAVLKSGAAYVPLDPSYPRDRLAHMLSDIDPVIVLTASSTLGCLPPTNARTLEMDSAELRNEVRDCSSANPNTPNARGRTPAYIIYTSGSTGKPKGAANHHEGLRNLVEAQREMYGLDSKARILQFASFSFDVCLFELIMALCNGGTLCLAPKFALLPVEPLIRTILELRITLVTLPPSALSHLPLGCLPESVAVNITGESFPPALAKAWAARHRVFNAYGPTETSIWASSFEVSGSDFSASVPIGRPLPNEQLYVLNERLALCPVGVPGDIYIGGTPVGLGYFRQEKQTDERFVPDHIFGAGKLYKTGDVGKWLQDGNLQFIGRKDNQIKLRGFRVELGEIEVLIAAIEGVREAVVVLQSEAQGARSARMVAYVAANASSELSPLLIRDNLRKFLPEFMIPAAFVMISSFPLTPNGKVDRNALSSMRPVSPPTRDAGEPQDENESLVMKLYCELLQRDSMDRDDDFFICGGHSLLAVQLVSRLRKVRGIEIPVREVFAHPTIVEFASIVAKYSISAGASLLTLMRAGDPEDVVFFVHSGEGEVGYVHQLLPWLPREISVFSLSAAGFLEDEVPLDSIQAMAERYVAAMRSVAPLGPFRIVGWSAGGTIAYEIARQLTGLDLDVAFVALLDCNRDYAGVIGPVGKSTEDLRPSILLAEWLQNSRGDELPKVAIDCVDELPLEEAVRYCQSEGLLSRDIGVATLLRWWAVRRSIAAALLDYVAPAIDCQVLLFAAQDSQNKDVSLGWQDLLGHRINVVLVPGNHHTMIKKPNAAHLGEALSYWLRPSRLESIG